MVEDVSGAIDALGKESLVDSSRISVFGYAMGGTVALYAGALDGRISNIVSVCGFSPMRSDKPGTPLSGMSRYSHLFAMQPRLGFFLGQEERLRKAGHGRLAGIAGGGHQDAHGAELLRLGQGGGQQGCGNLHHVRRGRESQAHGA